jgi:hypothetical protein
MDLFLALPRLVKPSRDFSFPPAFYLTPFVAMPSKPSALQYHISAGTSIHTLTTGVEWRWILQLIVSFTISFNAYSSSSCRH